MKRTDELAFLSLSVQKSRSISLTEQLYQQIRERILDGRLAAGARLHSTRRLARQLCVSRTVTLAAYDQLGAEGLLRSRRRSGLFVRDRQTKHASRRTVSIAPEAHSALGEPFDPAGQPGDLFPHQCWAKLVASEWREESEAATIGASSTGLPALRVAVAGYLYSLNSVDCAPDQVVITTGNSDALQLITRSLRSKPHHHGETVWVEDPGFVAARRTLAHEGLRVIAVPVDDHGLDIDAALQRGAAPRFILVTPARQFPLGNPMSLLRRETLLRWSALNDAIVIEDNYDTEVQFGGRLPSLFELAPDANVIAIGSFSKVTFPGLRLGYIACPSALATQVVATRIAHYDRPSAVGQPALAKFLRSGQMATHLAALTKELGRRRAALCRGLAKLEEHLDVFTPDSGMHVVVRLKHPTAAGDVAFATAAAQKGLFLCPLSAHYESQSGAHGFVLGFGGWPESVISDRLTLLEELLKGEARRHADAAF